MTPTSLDEAIECLGSAGDDAKLLAGGQTLLAQMAMRATRPAVLVDLDRVPHLDHIASMPGSGLVVGAMVRQRTAELHTGVAAAAPLLARALPHVASIAIRNQGTIGGSIVNADPAAELPAIAVATHSVLVVASAAGRRTVPAGEFFLGAQRTCLAADEILIEMRVPPLAPGSGCGFAEFGRRRGDVAIAGAAATVRVDAGRVASATIVVFGVATTPVRAIAAERLLMGSEAGQGPAGFELARSVLTAVGAAIGGDVDPATDLHATATYRRHLAGVMARRAVAEAVAAAAGERTGS